MINKPDFRTFKERQVWLAQHSTYCLGMMVAVLVVLLIISIRGWSRFWLLAGLVLAGLSVRGSYVLREELQNTSFLASKHVPERL
jgi:hypothetical protein